MECGRFVEEKLGDGEAPEFREHLAECAACRLDVEEIGDVRRLYREASVERYRGGVPAVFRRRSLPWVPAAAAAVMLGVLGFLLWVPARPVEVATTPTKVFSRLHLEPWDGDARYSNAVDEAWRKLQTLEGDW